MPGNKSKRLKNIDRTMQSISFADNFCSLRLYSNTNFTQSFHDSYPAECKKNFLLRNRSSQFQPYEKFYTTINGPIKCIADVVYHEVGEGVRNEQMSRANFNYWIEQNPQILDTFSKWLRTDIWTKSFDRNSDGLYQQSLRKLSAPNQKYVLMSI